MAYCSEWNSRRNLKASIFYAWRNCHCQHNAAVDPGPWTLDSQQFDFFENRYSTLPQKSVDENHGKQKRYPVLHSFVHDFENFPIFGDLRRIIFDIVILAFVPASRCNHKWPFAYCKMVWTATNHAKPQCAKNTSNSELRFTTLLAFGSHPQAVEYIIH